MAHLIVGLTLLYCTAFVISQKLGPCQKGDDACLTQSVNKSYRLVHEGIPSLGIESSDPLFEDEIVGDLSILKFKLTDSTVRGFKDCTVDNVKLNLDALTLSWVLDCPKLSMSGNYVINGRLIILPVEGQGTYTINSGRYVFNVDAQVKLKSGNDGKTYVSIANFKLKSDAREPVKFNFQNLFNGQKDLSDATHKFANENWKEVAELVQDPVMYKHIKLLVKNYNKFLKTQPLEEIFVN